MAMYVPRKSEGSSSSKGLRRSTSVLLTSDPDENFLRSLHEFIEHEKQYLRCPDKGADDLRYNIYHIAFNKVISRAESYRKLLLTIKAGYEDIIAALQKKEAETRMAKLTLTASTSHDKSVIACWRQATHLKQRISRLQRETTELQEEIQKQKLLREQRTWIPGLTMAEAEDPSCLDKHLKHLEAQRDALLDRKSQSVTLEVKAELDNKVQADVQLRDRLSSENTRLKDLYRRLSCVSNRLSSWSREKQQVPLEELFGFMLEEIQQTSVMEDDNSSIDAEVLEEDQPCGVDQSKFLTEHLDRFVEVFEAAQYEDAALLAARSPGGVLRNLETMEMFRDVNGPPGSVPPLLLFFQALLLTVPAGGELSAALSPHAVRCLLQHGATQLVCHAVTHSKLALSEDLGDILTEHAQKNPSVADMCLALSSVIYDACGLHRKAALSLCRRGLVHSAADFVNHCKEITAEDCLWVLRLWPSLSLLQLLTEPLQSGRASSLPATVACSTLLLEPRQQPLALQLLDGFVSRGVLEDVILQDSCSSVEAWSDVAALCSGLNRADLSRAVLSVLLDQSGTRAVSPDMEGARLVEHIFL